MLPPKCEFAKIGLVLIYSHTSGTPYVHCASVGHCLCLFLNLLSHIHTEQHRDNRQKDKMESHEKLTWESFIIESWDTNSKASNHLCKPFFASLFNLSGCRAVSSSAPASWIGSELTSMANNLNIISNLKRNVKQENTMPSTDFRSSAENNDRSLADVCGGG